MKKCGHIFLLLLLRQRRLHGISARSSEILLRLFGMLFFVASGAELKLSVIHTIGVVGIVYVVLRVAGKIFGGQPGQ